jgi:hypothetical protein
MREDVIRGCAAVYFGGGVGVGAGLGVALGLGV